MNVLNQYEQDGYTITEFENGTILKTIISDDIIEESEQLEEEYISQEEIYQAKVLTGLEYLKCLAEINGGI